jgi:hypothetical protein
MSSGLDLSLKSEHHMRYDEQLADSIMARYSGSVEAFTAIGQGLISEFESTVRQPTAGYNVITARTAPARPAPTSIVCNHSNDRVDTITDIQPDAEPFELTTQHRGRVVASARRRKARQ